MNHPSSSVGASPRMHRQPISASRKTAHFMRHAGEMFLAMLVGMAAGALALVLIFSTVLASNVQGMTADEVLARYPVLICLLVAAGMVATMVGWMRFRGMSWRPVTEMAAAMVVPLVPIFGLLWLDVLAGASACSVYCIAMIPAMLVAMLLRVDLYTASHAAGASTRHAG